LAYAHLLTTEAAAYYELNQLGPSRKAIEAAIEIRQQKLPQNHPEVAISLANLGNVEAATSNFEKALTCFEQAAAIHEHIGETASAMLGLNYLQIGRVYFLQGDHSRAYELYQKSEGIFNKQAGRNRHYTADLHYAYGNLEFAKGAFRTASRSYELCRRIITDYKPLHPLTSAAWYKLGCGAFELGNPRKALSLLDKALEIAYIRSGGRVDGTCARIQWKRAEILLDDSLATRKEEGRRLKRDIELRQTKLAKELGIDLRLDEVAEDKDREKTFDLLVPGYFR
jgi:tetratricopeptide (TPR) repeat protein